MSDIVYAFHKVTKDETNRAAEALTEAFIDYPQFVGMYRTKNKKRYRSQVYHTFLFWLYTLKDSFYTNDDVNCVVCFEKPTDKNPPSIVGLLPHPLFLLRCLFYQFSIRDFIAMADYLSFTDKYAKKYLQPNDSYLHLICTVGKARKSRIIFRFFLEHDEGAPFLLETHTDDNIRLYQRMGLDICETTSWRGVKHCIMRRPNDADFDYREALNQINKMDKNSGLSM